MLCLTGGFAILANYFFDKNREGLGATTCLVTTFLGVYAFAMLIWYPVSYSNITYYLSEISVLNEKEQIYQNQANNIVGQLKIEVSSYLKHEEDVYSKMNSKNASTMLAMYPQLRSVEAIKVLLTEISSLNKQIFEIKIKKQEYRAQLIFYRDYALYPFSVTVPD
jgi:hypothetical protein